MNERARHLRNGDVVEVRSPAEILGTVAAEHTLDGLPFMSEMRQFCGKRFRVFKRADKMSDIADRTGLRRLQETVILEGVRCDGSAHGGCQAGCQILWKEAWLRPVEPMPGLQRPAPSAEAPLRPAPPPADGGEVFRCQATEIRRASSFLAWWDVRQDFRDLRSGNVGPGEMARYFAFWIFRLALRVGGYRFLVAAYDAVQRLRGGEPYPYRTGRLKGRTPDLRLDLRPGDLVEVKSYPEILETLDTNCKNRGLWFDAEMVKYCGSRHRVLARVERLVDPKSGKLLTLTNDCIILDGVTTRGDYHRFNPRNEYIFWREIWLKRVDRER